MATKVMAGSVEIPLTRGLFAVVDNADAAAVLQYKWHAVQHKAGFVATHAFYKDGKVRHIPLHRFLLNPTDGVQIDHINHNTLDNRRCNLRICTNQQNAANARRSKKNTSGYKGVTFYKRYGKWNAQISRDGRTFNLGYYDNVRDAALAYQAKSYELFGEFAYQEGLNK